jgi:3-oxoisoapionate decarboxylase
MSIPVGIGQHSYSESWKPKSGAEFENALTFLEHAHAIGAAGVQVAIKADEQPNAAKIRARAEELGMWFEGNVVLPKSDGDVAAFEAHLMAIRAAGGTIARTACLSGRRYETFKTLAEFREFKRNTQEWLTRAEPLLRKQKIKLALENHKDWLAPEHLEILRKFSSEWIGALVDTGNSIALLENPYAVIEALAPFALSSHLKDMAALEYDEGFLLSEVPLGGGFLEIPRIVGVLRKANPNIRLNLEMITRDPLQVPCLATAYYATFEQGRASSLAATLAAVKANPCENVPRTTGKSAAERVRYEDENVRKCVAWAKANLQA